MEGTYHHILVALDGSPGAKCALRHAVGLAGLSRARLTVVSVAHAAPTLGESMAANAGVQVPSEAGWLEDELRHAVAALPADQPVTSYLRFGAPGRRDPGRRRRAAGKPDRDGLAPAQPADERVAQGAALQPRAGARGAGRAGRRPRPAGLRGRCRLVRVLAAAGG